MRAAPLPDPADPADRRRAVDAARQRRVHPDVRMRMVATTDAQRRSLAALDEGVCVVTGQQAGLFGGPLYTLHKAASAIRDAAALAAETGVPCAPVFWLQTEDHDVDEIRAATLLRADDLLEAVCFDVEPGAEGRSVAHRRMPGVERAVDALADAVRGLPHAEEVVGLHRALWRPEARPGDAMRGWLERLFADHGLLVVDPADPALAAAAAPIHAEAIDRAAPLSAALAAQTDALRHDGRPAPVHVRPGSPLSFVHPDGAAAARVRVTPRADGGWDRVGGGAPLDDAQLRRGPHSTSALLRPILQDRWLPTAAIVGGPGELAYLAQLPPLWEAFGLPIPVVAPRARFVVVDGPSPRLLQQLGLTVADLAADRDALLRRVARPADGVDPDALVAALTGGLPALEPLAGGPLGASADRAARTIRRAAERLAARVRREAALRDQVTVDRLDRARNRLYPGGPQERVHAWPIYAARHGVDTFVRAILDAVVPFDGALREVHL